jgi:hypothetical protein
MIRYWTPIPWLTIESVSYLPRSHAERTNRGAIHLLISLHIKNVPYAGKGWVSSVGKWQKFNGDPWIFIFYLFLFWGISFTIKIHRNQFGRRWLTMYLILKRSITMILVNTIVTPFKLPSNGNNGTLPNGIGSVASGNDLKKMQIVAVTPVLVTPLHGTISIRYPN